VLFRVSTHLFANQFNKIKHYTLPTALEATTLTTPYSYTDTVIYPSMIANFSNGHAACACTHMRLCMYDFDAVYEIKYFCTVFY